MCQKEKKAKMVRRSQRILLQKKVERRASPRKSSDRSSRSKKVARRSRPRRTKEGRRLGVFCKKLLGVFCKTLRESKGKKTRRRSNYLAGVGEVQKRTEADVRRNLRRVAKDTEKTSRV